VGSTYLGRLERAANRFRAWAETQPAEKRTGEWECDYEDWGEIYQSFEVFLEHTLVEEWDEGSMATVLYLMARDNEFQRLAGEIAKDPSRLLKVAKAALTFPDRDARWQMADELGKVKKRTGCRAEAEVLLLQFVQDEAEYVRRQALMALAKFSSPHVERLAVEIWNIEDESQQWARMAVLWSLQQIRSSLLESLLAEAVVDPREYLSNYAKKILDAEETP
jgi:hypothetical protein